MSKPFPQRSGRPLLIPFSERQWRDYFKTKAEHQAAGCRCYATEASNRGPSGHVERRDCPIHQASS